MNTRVLQVILALMIAGTAIKIWIDILNITGNLFFNQIRTITLGK